jgi:peptidoglycan/LPS O-acetylase OafA/YrhL
MEQRKISLADGPGWLSRGRVPCLDGIRALSILLVLLCHESNIASFPAPGWARPLLVHGNIGVDIFFVLSGFLITLLLLRELARTHEISLRGFYTRRGLRILPAYLTFVAVVFGLTHLGLAHLSTHDWWGLLTYTMNYVGDRSWAVGHMWSLSLEEQFYLMWPPLLLWLGPKRGRRLLLAYLVAAPVLRLGFRFAFPHNRTLAASGTLTRMDTIAAGCLLALFAAEPEFCRRTQVPGRKALLVGLAAAAVLAASLLMRTKSSFYAVLLSHTVNAAAITTLIWLCTTHSESRIGRLLQRGPLVALGTLSYGLYIWQQPFLDPASPSWVCRWPQNVLLALLAAGASYLLIESPFLRLKERQAASDGRPAAEGRGVKRIGRPAPLPRALGGGR